MSDTLKELLSIGANPSYDNLDRASELVEADKSLLWKKEERGNTFFSVLSTSTADDIIRADFVRELIDVAGFAPEEERALVDSLLPISWGFIQENIESQVDSHWHDTGISAGLFEAIRGNDIESLSRILTEHSLLIFLRSDCTTRESQYQSWSLLHMAASYLYKDMCEYLIEAGILNCMPDSDRSEIEQYIGWNLDSQGSDIDEQREALTALIENA